MQRPLVPRVLRLTLCLSLVGLGLSASARADGECLSHDHCGTGTWCVFQGTDCANGEVCGAAPVTGTCQPLPAGKCESDADCSGDQRCVKGELCDGADDASCVANPSQRYGTCVSPNQVACTSDFDCLAGLSCVREGSVGPTACTFTGDCALDLDYERPSLSPAMGVCAWAPRTCVSDGQCAEYEECAEVNSGMSCVEPADCALGEPCPGDGLPVCTPTVTRLCMPRKLACLSDAECPNELVCFDFAKHQLKVPEAWEESMDFKSCMPEGLAALFAGDTEPPSSEEPGGSQGGSGAGAPPGPDVGRTEVGSGRRGDAGHCSVRPGAGPSAVPFALGALLAMWGVLRRALSFGRRVRAPR